MPARSASGWCTSTSPASRRSRSRRTCGLRWAAACEEAPPVPGWWGTRRRRQGLPPAPRGEPLAVPLRQRLEIVKALATGPRILLLDEPTALLAPSEVEELLRLVRAFAAGGGAVALITHKLPEVFAAADRVTVLRHGVVRLVAAVQDETEASLAEAMIGGAASVGAPANPPGRMTTVPCGV